MRRSRQESPALLNDLKGMVRTRSWRLGMSLAIVAGASFKSTTAVGGTFLIDQGADEASLGRFFLLPVLILMSAGAAMGGRFADRLPRVLAVALFEGMCALCVATLDLLYVAGPARGNPNVGFVMLGLLYFSIGLATSAMYALLMDLTVPRMAATQFCTYMAGINLCESWSTRALGALIARFDYGGGFMAISTLSLLSLSLLMYLPDPPTPAGSNPPTDPVGPEGSTGEKFSPGSP